MVARSLDEPNRAASRLELFFDLTFVVAIAKITEELAHRIAAGELINSVTPFLQVFFAIWWAWMNFTWFASSYDTDDVLYRILTLLQIAGVLVLAVGVPEAVNANDYRAIAAGYFIMRIGLAAQWTRAAVEDPRRRVTALRYVVGISTAELGWLLRVALDESGVLPQQSLVPVFVALVLFELAVPYWAERGGPTTTWHPHHIAERYGLFTIILLGECVLGASTVVETRVQEGVVNEGLVMMAIAELLLVFALWWLYFLEPSAEGLVNRRDRSFLWGYGHYGIFVALAALGAGLAVAVQYGDTQRISPFVVTYCIAVPVSLFLTLLYAVNAPVIPRLVIRPTMTLGGALVILVLPLAANIVGPAAVVSAIATVCALIVALTLNRRSREHDLRDAREPL